jgi:pimeloyl-ACP methyl ester carboxylesterase
MDQGFFLYEHDFTVRQLAELVWQVGHQNIVDFLHDIPENRKLSLRYETLVGQPADEMRRLCTAVGIEFDPSMVDAYDKQTRRMTDPARPGSLMVGDTKFHQHGRIDKRLADGSAVQASMADFSAETRRLAEQLGYAASEEVEAPTTGPALVGVKSLSKRTLVCFQPRGCGTPMFFVHGVGGSVPNFRFLPDVFGPERPFFALQAPALEAGGEQFASIAEIAAAYVTVIRGHAASGPYLLGGWSFGGIVAWEMAQQLRAEGADVPVLVLLDSYAPEHFVADDAEMMVRFSFDFVASLGKYEHVVTRNDLLAAPPERWPSMVLDAGAKAGLIPAGLVDPERFAKLHLVYRGAGGAAQGC